MDTELDIFIFEYRKLLERKKLSIQSALLTGLGIKDYSDYRYFLGQYKVLEEYEMAIKASYEELAKQILIDNEE